MSFYAVSAGREIGIFGSWDECEAQVKGFNNAHFKKFKTRNDAINYLNDNGVDYTALLRNNEDSTTKNHELLALAASFSKGEGEEEEKLEDHTAIASTNQQRFKRKNSEPEFDTSESTCALFEQHKTIVENFKRNCDPQTIFSFKKKHVAVFTDGACSNNGRAEARAGVGIFWGVSHPLNTSRKLLGKQTNNRAEITAAIIAISHAILYDASELTLNTDSQFMINCMTTWIQGWKKNNWVSATGEPVKNISDLKYLDFLCSKIKVNWNYVTAHNGIFGNEEADRLARLGLQ